MGVNTCGNLQSQAFSRPLQGVLGTDEVPLVEFASFRESVARSTEGVGVTGTADGGSVVALLLVNVLLFPGETMGVDTAGGAVTSMMVGGWGGDVAGLAVTGRGCGGGVGARVSGPVVTEI